MDTNVTVTTPLINRVVRSASMTLLSFLAVVGNAFCLLILRRAKNLWIKDTTKIFVASLTCSDLCLGVFGAIPVSVSAAFGHFPSPQTLLVPFCFYHSVFVYFISLIRSISLLAVTTERYFAVVYPLRYPVLVTVRRCKIVVALLWIIQCIFMVMVVLIVQPQLSGQDEDLDPDYLVCFPPSPASGVGETKGSEGFFSLICVFIFIPILTILFMYSRMLIIARRHTAKIKASILKTTRAAFASVVVKRQTDSENRATMTFITVTTASIIAWLPFTAVTFQEYVLWRSVEPHWKFLTIYFFFSGCWFNVALYYVGNKQFRATAKQVIFSRRRDPDLPTTPGSSLSNQQ